MNTKEAIEFCETFKDKITDIDMENGDAEMMEEYNNEISKVITLLQQGEKYRQMWKKLDNGKYVITHFNKAGYLLESITPQEFEQKYFPKEAKSDGS